MRQLGIALAATILLIGSAGIALAGDAPGSCQSAGKALAAVAAEDAEFADFAERCVSLNQVQVLGSHNSYHIQPAPSLDLLLRLSDPPGPELSLVWEYTHVPLDEQFSFQGIRQIELDVFLDPAGGLYAAPLGNALVAAAGLPPDPDHDPEGVLLQPSFKVLHVQDLDFRSTCLTLASCLDEIQQWSSEHPRHLPLLVLIELKDDPLPSDLPFVVPPLYQAEDLDDLDALIRSVFPSGQLVTPDDVRGKRKSLEEAVLNDGWPVLEESRGRVIFALDNGGEIRDLYVDGHPSLEGRVLFTDSSPGQPEAAFMKRNNPVSGFEEIQDLVRRGYIVRTRADADTLEARFGVTGRRDAALESGAQFVSTDYPVPDPDFGTGYFVEIPDGAPARCNPLNAPPGCRNFALEVLE
jgi:hypothetical protein